MKSLKNNNLNYVYILKCNDDTFYTGWTNNLINRVNTHNEGKGAKYTRGRTPCKLIYFESFETKSQALKRECAIKKLSRLEKVSLVDNFSIPKDIKDNLIV